MSSQQAYRDPEMIVACALSLAEEFRANAGEFPVNEFSMAYYARITANEKLPRVLLHKIYRPAENLKRIKEAFETPYGLTLNARKGIEERLGQTGRDNLVVRDDPFGFCRGLVVRKAVFLVHEVPEKGGFVYFDRMKEGPAFARELCQVFDEYVPDRYLEEHGSLEHRAFSRLFVERLELTKVFYEQLERSESEFSTFEKPDWKKMLVAWEKEKGLR
jgi:hypothetical protein